MEDIRQTTKYLRNRNTKNWLLRRKSTVWPGDLIPVSCSDLVCKIELAHICLTSEVTIKRFSFWDLLKTQWKSQQKDVIIILCFVKLQIQSPQITSLFPVCSETLGRKISLIKLKAKGWNNKANSSRRILKSTTSSGTWVLL